jgi:hypothetical protein
VSSPAQVLHLTPAEAQTKGPPPAGNLAIPWLQCGELEVEFYAPAGGTRSITAA